MQGADPQPPTLTRARSHGRQRRHQLRVAATVAAPPEQVYRALTDASVLAQWMHLRGKSRVVKTDPRVGGEYRFELSAHRRVFVEVGTYRNLQPPEQIVYSCRFGSPGFIDAYEFTTRVDLRRVPEGTRVIVRGYGFSRRDQRDEQRATWPALLARLSAFLRPESKTAPHQELGPAGRAISSPS